jgi:hypothetical protein
VCGTDEKCRLYENLYKKVSVLPLPCLLGNKIYCVAKISMSPKLLGFLKNDGIKIAEIFPVKFSTCL